MNKMKYALLVLLIPNIYFVNAPLLKLMTDNIRLELASDGENDWHHRKELLTTQISFYEPDILGVQEAMPGQINYLVSSLTFLNHTGIGREGINKGEACAIFYNHSRFEIIKTNTFWLSDTPDSISKGWDASYVRICTYALFKDKRTRKKFWVFNTHLDNDGNIARTKGVELMIKRMKEVNAKNLPIIFMGDFNATPEDELISHIKMKMDDTKDVSVVKPFGPSGTFNAFDFSKPVIKRIDYIFISKTPKIKVNKYAVLSDSDNLSYPSDHLPVYVELIINY
ncbi:MAG: endonuclease/exonuclease/phosphatase family protein [Bacteroidales bacterium]|nr:endonuclease/exonuclease/phosphatase family protein [Bacteroidales bacterium]